MPASHLRDVTAALAANGQRPDLSGCAHPGDPYLPLKALAAYSGLSIRTLRGHLRRRQSPLPHYRPGGKILVRRSEFDAWMRDHFHQVQDPDHAAVAVNRLVDELCVDVASTLTAARQQPENRALAPQQRPRG